MSSKTVERIYNLMPELSVMANDEQSQTTQAIVALAIEIDQLKDLLCAKLPNGVRDIDPTVDVDFPANSPYGLALQFAAACYEAGKHTEDGMKLAPERDRVKCNYLRSRLKKAIADLSATYAKE